MFKIWCRSELERKSYGNFMVPDKSMKLAGMQIEKKTKGVNGTYLQSTALICSFMFTRLEKNQISLQN